MSQVFRICALPWYLLLERNYLGHQLEKNLRENLETELGLNGGFAHTELFARMAKSIGVELAVPAPMGSLISHVIGQAMHTSLELGHARYCQLQAARVNS